MSKMPAGRTAEWSRIFDRYARPGGARLKRDDAKAEKPLCAGKQRLGALEKNDGLPQTIKPDPR